MMRKKLWSDNDTEIEQVKKVKIYLMVNRVGILYTIRFIF